MSQLNAEMPFLLEKKKKIQCVFKWERVCKESACGCGLSSVIEWD